MPQADLPETAAASASADPAPMVDAEEATIKKEPLLDLPGVRRSPVEDDTGEGTSPVPNPSPIPETVAVKSPDSLSPPKQQQPETGGAAASSGAAPCTSTTEHPPAEPTSKKIKPTLGSAEDAPLCSSAQGSVTWLVRRNGRFVAYDASTAEALEVFLHLPLP